jgi:glucose-6-phosphate 1-dehydrogenase
MHTIKILLLGITGDLATRKVLPAIAQFAQINKNQINTQLIGYSRSKADTSNILNILNTNSLSGSHSLQDIQYIQGQYEDAKVLDNIFSKLKENERLIIYLAIPPIAFIPFLQNTCPLNTANIDIIIEKPFGQNLEEAENIITQTKTCNLTRRIHFFDHYAFKGSSTIDQNILDQFVQYTNVNIKKVSIQALESVSAEGRAGYFDQTGTLKDMFQHLTSIYQLAKSYFELPVLESKNIIVEDIVLGQYDTYTLQNNKQSITDTYFKIDMKDLGGLQITAESGKSLGIKSTDITLELENGVCIVWNLDPQKCILVIQNGIEVDSFNLKNDNMLDHTRLFDAIVSDDFSRFVNHEQILETWKLYNLLNTFNINNNMLLIPYKSGFYPIQKI